MTWPTGSVETRATTARLEESVTRPSTSSSPVRSTDDGVRSALVAIGPRADVARGVEGVATEGARRPAGCDEGVGATREGARLRRREADADRVAPEGADLVVLRLLVHLVGVVVVALDDELLALLVPGERQRLHAPVLVEGGVQRLGVLRRPTGLARLRGQRGRELVEHVVAAVGEDRALLLLAPHGDDQRACARLQVEGPLTGRADRPGDEPVSGIEVLDRHAIDPIRRVRPLTGPRPRPRRPPRWPAGPAGAGPWGLPRRR